MDFHPKIWKLQVDDLTSTANIPGTLSPPAAIWALKSRNSLEDGWRVPNHYVMSQEETKHLQAAIFFHPHLMSENSILRNWETKTLPLGILHHTVEQGSSCKFSMSASFLFLFCTATVLMLLTSCCIELLRRQPHFAAKLFQVRLARMKQTARLKSTRHNYPDSSCMMSWLQEPLVKSVISSSIALPISFMTTWLPFMARITRRGNCRHHTSQRSLPFFARQAMGTWRLWPRHKFWSFPPRNPAVRIRKGKQLQVRQNHLFKRFFGAAWYGHPNTTSTSFHIYQLMGSWAPNWSLCYVGPSARRSASRRETSVLSGPQK